MSSLSGAQCRHVLIELSRELLHGRPVRVELPAILGDFDRQFTAHFSELVQAMDIYDGLFKANRDEEADGDGRDVDEEALPASNGLVRSVDFEHGLESLRWERMRSGNAGSGRSYARHT